MGQPMCQAQPPLRRPLIGLVLLFMAGTWGAVMIGGLPPGWAGAACLLLLVLSGTLQVAARFLQRRRSAGSVFHPVRPRLPGLLSWLAALGLYLAVGAGAWFAAGLRLDDPSPDALSALLAKPRESVEVEGVICDDPVVRPAADGLGELCNFPFRLEMIHRLIPWQSARGTLQVAWPLAPGASRPQYGERWRLAGVLIDNARFPEEEGDGSSSRPVLDWLNRRYLFRADAQAAVFLGAGQGAPIMEACFQARRRCADTLALGIGHRPEIVGLLQALLLGYRQELPEKVRNDFTATGTYHIFAISGQHVAILALFIVVVLQSYRVARVKWFLYVMPLLAGFTLATGLSSSAVRGCLMALLCFLGPLAGRRPDIPSAMALAALLILGLDPFALFDYGFLLSFTAVTGLIVLCPPLLQRLAPALEPDPLRLQPEPRFRRWTRRALRVVVLLFVSSLAAGLATAPLVARWFNLVSPIALLANLIVIPVTTLILLAGCLSMILGLFAPILGELFNFTNVVLVSSLLWVTDRLAQIPYGHAFIRSPPLWAVAAWYGVLAAWLTWHRAWAARRGAWLAWLAAPAILGLLLSAGRLGAWNTFEFDLLNNGDCPAVCINDSAGKVWVINPGSRYNVRKVIGHLRRQGVNRLQIIVLSGGDSAQAGGAPDLLQALPVGELLFPPGAENSRALRKTLELARRRGVLLRAWSNGVSFAAEGSGARISSGLRRSIRDGVAAQPGLAIGRDNAGPAALTIFQGEAKDAPAWLWRQGNLSILYLGAAANSVRPADLVRRQVPELKATVLIEDLMAQGLGSANGALPAADFQAAWRVVCDRKLSPDAESGGSPSLPNLRLSPGQGLRMRIKHGQVRWEPFTP